MRHFFVKSCYNLIVQVRDLGIPWKDIWSHNIPLKICFFLSLACLGKISMLDVLNQKGMFLPNMCLLCYNDWELASHILLHCPFAREVWSAMLRDFGLTWVSSLDVCFVICSWRTNAFNAQGKQICCMIPAAVCLTVWLKRNNKVFENDAEASIQTYRRAKILLLFWSRRILEYDNSNRVGLIGSGIKP